MTTAIHHDAITNPTRVSYGSLNEAYDHFNKALFSDKLPRCLITMQRRKGAYGYFWAQRFASRDGTAITDEIALNPSHFRQRSSKQTLSTLVHEMVHLRQQHEGTPSKSGYHNTEWADMMDEVGLTPSTTAAPGGKRTGPKCSHFIVDGGRFDKACNSLLDKGFDIHFGEVGRDEQAAAKKRASKTRYTCGCCGAHAWAKPSANIRCGDCDEQMEPEL